MASARDSDGYCNAWNNMAGGSSLLTESSWSGRQSPNQNVDKGKARDLPIRDHVSKLTIYEDGKEN